LRHALSGGNSIRQRAVFCGDREIEIYMIGCHRGLGRPRRRNQLGIGMPAHLLDLHVIRKLEE
jgi:hypothetical protein